MRDVALHGPELAAESCEEAPHGVGFRRQERGQEAVEVPGIGGTQLPEAQRQPRRAHPTQRVVGDDVVVLDAHDRQQQRDEDPRSILADGAVDHRGIRGGVGQHRQRLGDRLVRRQQQLEIVGRHVSGFAPSHGGGLGERIAERQVVVANRQIRVSTGQLDFRS